MYYSVKKCITIIFFFAKAMTVYTHFQAPPHQLYGRSGARRST